jgi:hypothetical protein
VRPCTAVVAVEILGRLAWPRVVEGVAVVRLAAEEGLSAPPLTVLTGFLVAPGLLSPPPPLTVDGVGDARVMLLPSSATEVDVTGLFVAALVRKGALVGAVEAAGTVDWRPLVLVVVLGVGVVLDVGLRVALELGAVLAASTADLLPVAAVPEGFAEGAVVVDAPMVLLAVLVVEAEVGGLDVGAREVRGAVVDLAAVVIAGLAVVLVVPGRVAVEVLVAAPPATRGLASADTLALSFKGTWAPVTVAGPLVASGAVGGTTTTVGSSEMAAPAALASVASTSPGAPFSGNSSFSSSAESPSTEGALPLGPPTSPSLRVASLSIAGKDIVRNAVWAEEDC